VPAISEIVEESPSQAEEEGIRVAAAWMRAGKNTREYAHMNSATNEEHDFTETVYYATGLKTQGGVASARFQLSDAPLAFIVRARAIDGEGLIGEVSDLL